MTPTRQDTFEALFREHYAAVRGYAFRRAAADAAQDVVAETFLVAWRRLDDVPDDALPWLFGVARRVLANERRSADRRAALEHRVATDRLRAGSPDAAERLADIDLIRAALASLSERHREALTLVAWHGLSGARAARAAGCSPPAFAVRLHRARARLAAEVAALEAAATAPVAPQPVEAS